MINITINENEYQVSEGSTILEAIRSNGMDITTLCYLKECLNVGKCGVCAVEVEGKNNLVLACLTKVEEGMVIKTDTEKDISRLEITIHEGKNRQVRKMCEAVGRKVLALHRSKIGGIGVKDIELGKWRYLTANEVQQILKNS